MYKTRDLKWCICARFAFVCRVWRRKIALNKQTSNGPAALEFTVAKPESVGFHRERLVRLHALMQRNVEETAPGIIRLC
jgi:hypothetical protein